MSLLYIEFLYPINDYRKTLQRDEFIFDWIFPLLIAFFSAIYICKYDCTIAKESADSLFKTIITLLSILIGFTISSIAILTSTADKLKEIDTERSIGSTNISLYQLTNILFIFTLFSEIISLIINLIAVLMISYDIPLIVNHLNVFIVVDLFLISNVLFLNIRNMSNFYFILHILKT